MSIKKLSVRKVKELKGGIKICTTSMTKIFNEKGTQTCSG